jgi:5-methylthioadenosine/S-adenosylhomocysteine deaminase
LRARGIATAARARTSIQLLATLGVLKARPLLIHCVRVDDDDVSSIARARCGVAHCPASNAKLGHGIAPLVEFLNAGIAVGLGSDSMASNNRMDLLEEARLAALFQNTRLAAPTAVSAAVALTLATLGGARAVGLDQEIGSLEPGKSADLAAFPVRHLAPTLDPEVAAVFALAGQPASFVCVAGRALLRDGDLLVQDRDLDARVQRTADALAAWLAGPGRHTVPT